MHDSQPCVRVVSCLDINLISVAVAQAKTFASDRNATSSSFAYSLTASDLKGKDSLPP